MDNKQKAIDKMNLLLKVMPKVAGSVPDSESQEEKDNQKDKESAGFDLEIFFIGTQMAMYHIGSGAHRFIDFARMMVADLGDAIWPYLKTSYEGARAMPGMEELVKKMDPYEYVSKFDVNQNFEEETEKHVINTKEEVKEEADELIEKTGEKVSDIQEKSRKPKTLNLLTKNNMNTENNNKTAEEVIAELNLTEEYFPHLSKWEDKEHLLRTLQGIAKASGGTLMSAAVNLELDLSMM
ncbi:MAG TPA: hypothetical protein PLJ19_03125 [Dysgonamonadaceae bacterium]|nr:hypothetical protein [Dysgonamonadaceae bacterium]